MHIGRIHLQSGQPFHVNPHSDYSMGYLQPSTVRVICTGAGNGTEWDSQAGRRGPCTEQGADRRDDWRFRRQRLRVIFADLSQRIRRRLPAEIRLLVHYARQHGLRCSCRLLRYI